MNLPTGWHTITPRIFTEDSEGLVTFIKRTFDATGDHQTTRPTELLIGDSMPMISGTEYRERQTAYLYVYVLDVDSVFEKAINAGAQAVEEPAIMHYGDKRCTIADIWGNTWQIASKGQVC